MSKEIIEIVKYTCDNCMQRDIVPCNKIQIYLSGTNDYSNYAHVDIDLQLAYSGTDKKHVCKKCAQTLLERAIKEIQ